MKNSTWIIIALAIFAFIFTLNFLSQPTTTGNVALIPIKGVITGEPSTGWTSSGVSSPEIIKYIEQANEDRSIDLILFEINSPGGSAVASDEIVQAIKASKKPTVSWIRESGASGAYWIASSTDHIIANRMSITGSVGVIASYIEFGEFFDEYNITYRELTAGEYKGIGDPFDTMSREEQIIMQEKLDIIHQFFLDDVQQNRNLSAEIMGQVDTGVFFLGVEAYDLELVDELGGKKEVNSYITTLLDEEPDYIIYASEPTFMEILFGANSIRLPEFSIRS